MEGVPHKWCKGCKTWKPEDRFSKSVHESDNKFRRCKDCTRESTLRHKERPETLEKFGTDCGICGKDLSAGGAVIDHCYDSNEVRGVLCNPCNAGIGNLNDDVVLLGKAIEYLTNAQKCGIMVLEGQKTEGV